VSGVRRVIVGASGSPGSLRALRFAADLARDSDALLISVLAWSPPGGDLAERRAPCPPLRGVWEDAARGRLAGALEAAWGTLPEGLAVRQLVERGEPGPVLVSAADAAGDVLVVGAGRRGFAGRIVGGRVCRYCLFHAQCPVVGVPPAALPHGAFQALRGWTFRHREQTLDQALRDWGRAPA
jgi:nucleotide-binding universal stress UspA family protein